MTLDIDERKADEVYRALQDLSFKRVSNGPTAECVVCILGCESEVLPTFDIRKMMKAPLAVPIVYLVNTNFQSSLFFSEPFFQQGNFVLPYLVDDQLIEREGMEEQDKRELGNCISSCCQLYRQIPNAFLERRVQLVGLRNELRDSRARRRALMQLDLAEPIAKFYELLLEKKGKEAAEEVKQEYIDLLGISPESRRQVRDLLASAKNSVAELQL